MVESGEEFQGKVGPVTDGAIRHLRFEVARHDAEMERLWDLTDKAASPDAQEAIFCAMDASARRVGEALYTATAGFNSRETILSLCGRGPNRAGMPGAIPGIARTFTREVNSGRGVVK